MNMSKYNDTRDLKIVYYLGAGASYNSVPIQEKLGLSMVEAVKHFKSTINDTRITNNITYKRLRNNKSVLIQIANDIEYFGFKATEYGSLDIYARRLSLLGLKDELNRLKFSLSTFLVFWENFVCNKHFLKEEINDFYQNVDKRYLSLLSVLLNENPGNNPKLNENVSFLSWNYDLQIEKAYQTFMLEKTDTITQINNSFTFLNSDNPGLNKDIIHLNGFSGVYNDNGKDLSVLSDNTTNKIEDFLLNLLDNVENFKNHNSRYNKYIRYAWEKNSNLESARKVMLEADVLIVIGYSFPAFNRLIDAELMDLFIKGDGLGQVVYQDPKASDDIMESFFGKNNMNIVIKRDDPKQFHIPHEFLNPKPPSDLVF